MQTESPTRQTAAESAAMDREDRKLLRKAQRNNTEATNRIIENQQALILRIAAKIKRKYFWIDEDDLAQYLSITVYRHIKRFDLKQKGNCWRKYSYFRLHGEALQWLRQLDPLGIKWPHRRHYPTWAHFGQMRNCGEDDVFSAVSLAAVSPDLPLSMADEFLAGYIPPEDQKPDDAPALNPWPALLDDLCELVGKRWRRCLDDAGAVVDGRCRRCDGRAVIKAGGISCSCSSNTLATRLEAYHRSRQTAALWLSEWLREQGQGDAVAAITRRERSESSLLCEWLSVADRTRQNID